MKDVLIKRNSRKRGITVSMAVTMILIISLITTTITISVVHTVKNSKLRGFATELSLVQDTIKELSFTGSVNEYITRDVTLTLNNTEQFQGEDVVDNSVLLHVLDLSKMGITSSMYGTGKNDSEKDYYALSTDTMKVYYIAGYDAGDKVYYTMTQELYNMLNGITKSSVNSNNIVFAANYIDWTNKPIKVTVRVPKAIDTSSVTVTTDNTNILKASAFTLNGEYNELEVNTSNVESNYTVTVTYSIDGTQKTQTYAVTNFDNESPTAIMGKLEMDSTGHYVSRVCFADNGRVKTLKYVDLPVEESVAKEFFKTNGYVIKDSKIKSSSKDTKFTIYVEDYAGNFVVSSDVVTVPNEFYYVGGSKDTGVVISDVATDSGKGVDFTCTGNQFVWIPVDYTATGVLDSNGLDTGFTAVFKRGEVKETSTGSGIYKMTGTLSSSYTEPYTNGYSTEIAEYNDMMSSVQEYSGFYLARFEAGDGSVTTKRTAATSAHTIVSKKGAIVYNYVPWGSSMTSIGTTGAVYLSKNMYKDSTSVVSTLCYGVQWDAALNYVSDETHNINSSQSWGNFYDSTGDAAIGSGEANMNWTTGRNEAWKAKNIYDLAGNLQEWIMEASGTAYREARGGRYVATRVHNPAADRSGSSPAMTIVDYGFRPALYIKTSSVPIPEGFYYVGGGKETGLVISDNANDENKGVDYTCVGNQFVWVPVEDYSKFVRGFPAETTTGSGIYKMTETVYDTLTEPFESGYSNEATEYQAMCESVRKNKGFYIARFEAGDGDITELRQTAVSKHTVVSKKNVYVYNCVPWGKAMNDTSTQTISGVANVSGAVELSKDMYKGSTSVVSTLCYGVQWDAAMNFVSDATHSIMDSRTWGNYSDSTGSAATNSGNASTGLTGNNEAWQAKNIYDLAGNTYEWTMEAFSGGRVVRGGSLWDSGQSGKNPASSREQGTVSSAELAVSFRVALYII